MNEREWPPDVSGLAAVPTKISRLRLLVAVALMVLPPSVVALPQAPELLKAILAIGWIFVSVPVTIALVLDWFRSPSPSGPWARIGRHLLRLPLAMLGLASVAIGVGVILWVAYNLLIERQREFRPGSIMAMVPLILFGWYLLRLTLVPEKHN